VAAAAHILFLLLCCRWCRSPTSGWRSNCLSQSAVHPVHHLVVDASLVPPQHTVCQHSGGCAAEGTIQNMPIIHPLL
jgi:hypothetical protein